MKIRNGIEDTEDLLLLIKVLFLFLRDWHKYAAICKYVSFNEKMADGGEE